MFSPHPNSLPNGAREPIARAADWLFTLSQRGEGVDRAGCGLAFHPLPFRERAGVRVCGINAESAA
ncbi:hypothetical protein TUM17576_00040 [Enterobacter hormaechei]|nr:hypothetical protein TUM17576_00040 [Enterobacter hormaechei]